MIKNSTLSIFLFLTLLLGSCQHRIDNGHAQISSASYYELENAVQPKSQWPKENKLHIHLSSEPDNLHPINGNSTPRTEIFQYIHRYLVRINVKDGSLIPDLCDSLPHVSNDGKKWTFRLKENVHWDNGAKVTSEDIFFTVKINKWLWTRNHSLGNYWDNVENLITEKDDRTFSVLLKSKSFHNIAFFTNFPILQRAHHDPAQLLSQLTIDKSDDSLYCSGLPATVKKWADLFNDPSNGRKPELINGCGLYRLEEWQQGLTISLSLKEQQENRKGIKNNLPERIIYSVIKDDNSLLLSFRNQSVDLSTSLSLNTFFSLMKDERQKENYKGLLMPTYSYTYIALNEKPVESNRPDYFSNQNVRRAAALLTPVDDILQAIYKEFGPSCKRMASNVSPLKPECNPYLKPIGYKPDNAKLLLKASGWTDRNGDGVLDHPVSGRSFTPELLYLNNNGDWKDMAMLIAASFRKAGIEIKLTPVDLNLFLSRARSHDFDMLLGTWNNSIFPEEFHQLWHTSSWITNGSNYSGFGSKASDALIDSLQLMTDMSDRIRLSRKLQKIIYEDQPYVFMYCTLRRNIIHNRFSNRFFFSERPGFFANRLRLLTSPQGINPETDIQP